MTRLLRALVVALILASGLAAASPASAASVDGAAETRLLQLLNMARAGSGRPMLALDASANNVSRDWAGYMASTTVLQHNPNYVAQISSLVTNSWTRVGENVGVGGNADSLHQAFWNSPGHRANVLGDYNRVGIGAVASNGRVWVALNFIKGPAISSGTGVGECSATPGYMMDGYGGIHTVGGAPSLPASGYWNGWDIARDLSLNAERRGYKLDGFGGLHPVGGAPSIGGSGYWAGWDIAQAIAATPDGAGAYVLDGYGGIHAAGSARPAQGSGYWRGWRIARDIAVDPTSGSRGYVLDGFGGLHPFGGMSAARGTGYWGADVARSFVMLPDGTGGYVVDSSGGVWPFAVGNNAMPPAFAKLTPIESAVGAFALVQNGAATMVTSTGARLGIGQVCGVTAPWGSWSIVRSASNG